MNWQCQFPGAPHPSSNQYRACGKTRQRQYLARCIILGIAVTAIPGSLDCAPLVIERKPAEHRTIALAAAYFKNLKLGAKNCRRVTLYFDRVSTFKGRPVRRFRLFRDGNIVNTVTPNWDKDASIQISVGDGWFYPGDGAQHIYSVEVENDAGEKDQSARLTYRANTCPNRDQSFVIVKLTPSDLLPYPEIASDNRVQHLLGSSASERSLSSWDGWRDGQPDNILNFID